MSDYLHCNLAESGSFLVNEWEDEDRLEDAWFIRLDFIRGKSFCIESNLSKSVVTPSPDSAILRQGKTVILAN